MGARRREGVAWTARAWSGLALGAAIAGAAFAFPGARVAEADDADAPTHLEYRAGAGCPTEDAFVARVRARMPRVRFVVAGAGARTFLVELAVSGAHPSGSLRALEGARSEGARRIEAATCADVADALALMLVLAIDPRSLSSGAVGPLPALDADVAATAAADAGAVFDASAPDASVSLAAGDAGAPPPDAGAGDVFVEPPPPPPLPPVLALPPLEPPPPAPPAPSRLRSALTDRFFVGADFVVATGIAPVVYYSVAPVLGWRVTTWPLLSLNLRASFVRADTGTVTTVGGSSDSLWDVGRVDACGMLWPRRRLHLGACVRVEAGVLEVSGRNVVPSNTQDSPWVAAGALGRIEWRFFGPLELGLNAGLAEHITAKTFIFRPDTRVYGVSDLGFWGEAGVAVHFL